MLQTLTTLLEVCKEVFYAMNACCLPVYFCECKMKVLVFICRDRTVLLMHAENNFVEWFHNCSLLGESY
jgi:hypothetical protein